MNNDSQPTELTDQERKALELLDRERASSPAMEERVVAALIANGSIRAAGSGSTGSGWLRGSSLLAASLAMLLVGYLVGRAGAPEPVSSSTVKTAEASKFMLLLYEPEADHLRPDPDQLENQANEYRAWGNGLGEKGLLVAGEPLRIGGRMLQQAEGGVVQAASHPVPAELILGGYFMIYADTLEEAVKIAEESPHLRYNGTIIVRQIGFGEVTEESPGS
jgi:hypothetical protein